MRRIFSKESEFYVLYNGKEVYTREATLKLSQAFKEQTEQPNLELIVKVVNINRHNEHPLLELCKPINEYSIFVDTIRKWKEIDPINGFQSAIEECIANNILKEYLKRKTKEVLNMLLAEYDYETDIAVQRAEEREIAFAQGIEQGISQGISRGKSLGLAEGSRQKALETAKTMLTMGYPLADICKIAGLSPTEVKAL